MRYCLESVPGVRKKYVLDGLEAIEEALKLMNNAYIVLIIATTLWHILTNHTVWQLNIILCRHMLVQILVGSALKWIMDKEWIMPVLISATASWHILINHTVWQLEQIFCAGNC